MPHPLAADTVIRDLHLAAVADDALEFGAAALVFAAGALVAARWPEDALAEKLVLLWTQCAVVDGFGLLDLAARYP